MRHLFKALGLISILIGALAVADNYTYIQGPSLIESSSTTTTAAGTTTLTAASNTNQQFTGSSTQTVVLPVATTLKNGRKFVITNRSTGLVTVKDGSSTTIDTVNPGAQATYLLVGNLTAAGSWDESNSIPESLTNMEQTGFYSWGSGTTYYTLTGGKLQLDRGGTGYVKSQKVTWLGSQQTSVFSANTLNFVYVNSAGVIGNTTTRNAALFTDNIILFEVLYDGTNYSVVKENHPYTYNVGSSLYTHNTTGPVINNSGAIVTRVATGTGGAAGDREVKIVGADVLSDHGLDTTISDSAGAGVTWNFYYTDGSGNWTRYAQQSQIPMYYNNAGTPTALGTGPLSDTTVYVLYVSKDDLNSSTPTYYAVMDSAVYNTIAAATTAISNNTISRATAELYNLELAQLGYAVVENNGTSGYINTLTVSKSTVNQQFVGGGVAGTAGLILTNTSLFNSILSGSDTNVQSALDTLDDGAIAKSVFTAKAQVLVASGSATPTPLPTPTASGLALISNPSTATGLDWGSVASAPGGSTTQIQYNNAGAFAGSSKLTWSDTKGVLGITSIGTRNMMIGTGTVGSALTVNNTDTILLGDSAGAALASTAFGNIFLGSDVGKSITSGSTNVIIGPFAGDSLATTSTQNICIGYQTCRASTTPTGMTAVGYQALRLGRVDYNVGIGWKAADALTTGTNTVAIGANAMGAVSTNGANTALGDQAGATVTGSGNVFIGSAADGVSATQDSVCIGRNSSCGHTQSVAIGTNAATTSNNQIVLGTGTEGVVIPSPGPLTVLGGSVITTYASASTNGYLSSTDWSTFNGAVSSSPPGTVITFAGTNCPTGYIAADGSSLDRTGTYANLFAAISTNYGTEDGSHFTVPDMRGKFARGVDGGVANDPDRATRTACDAGGATGDNVGSCQADATNKNALALSDSGHSHGALNASGASTGGSTYGWFLGNAAGGVVQGENDSTSTNTTGITLGTGDSETRPINVSFLYCIKY